MSTTRRNFLKAAVLFPVFIKEASAHTNSIVRNEFKYQSTPKDDMNCAACLEFIPGDKDLGGCKVIPGDDEISPLGYCIKWNSM